MAIDWRSVKNRAWEKRRSQYRVDKEKHRLREVTRKLVRAIFHGMLPGP